MLLSARSLTKTFGDTLAVDGVSFELNAGETLALIGESGCGKTTTLRMINRLIEPTSGEVILGGEEAHSVPAHDWRRRIGYVVQTAGLFPHFSNADNIAVTPRLLGWETARIEARTHELMDMIGLPASAYGDRTPDQLSGGQRQRIGLARALAAEPSLLLMDEPFAALDPVTKDGLIDDVLGLRDRLGFAAVIVTHSFAEAIRFADRIAVMQAGQIVQLGSAQELINAPANDDINALLQVPLRNAKAVDALFRTAGEAS